ncbi:MAG TPA: tyrosine-type recombinase/integrase [Actinospica sp.]|jgi:integrase|nr:tyrosine-type recombinase/integrase [Actinospica sp.]
MRNTVNRGRVYRRCGCRDHNHRQLGAGCPTLHTDPGHGTWSFAVDLPNPERRSTIRRGGFPTEETARTALRRLLEGTAAGFNADPNQTLADYLTEWLEAKRLQLKPTTFTRYNAHVHQDLIPALGTVRLDDLGYTHIAAYVHTQLANGRGQVTVYWILATLSSALGDAVRRHRLPRNPARPTVLPRPAAQERRIWTPEQAARFLRHRHSADPAFADLIEVLIGTGMRKGEALGLHWNDIHLDTRTLYIRWSLCAVDNNRLVLGTPKTRTSKNWIAISDRVATALEHRANEKTPTTAHDFGGGYVFTRPDGRPLHPGYVLRHFHTLSDHADVPRCTVHDLRHLAATISITEGVPLTVVSKTLRHSTLSTTANIYSHLTAQAARDAVDTIDNTLTRADRASRHPTTPVPLESGRRPLRDHRTEPTETPKHPTNPVIRRHRPLRPRSRATTMRPRHTR